MIFMKGHPGHYDTIIYAYRKPDSGCARRYNRRRVSEIAKLILGHEQYVIGQRYIGLADRATTNGIKDEALSIIIVSNTGSEALTKVFLLRNRQKQWRPKPTFPSREG